MEGRTPPGGEDEGTTKSEVRENDGFEGGRKWKCWKLEITYFDGSDPIGWILRSEK